MQARFSEIVIYSAIIIALAAATLVLPFIEKMEARARKSRWMIIDREFIDFQEGWNG